MDYFYSNISMIPDERSFMVRDIATRGIIGTLDESFVLSLDGPYAMFVAKGRTWRVVEQLEEELLVEETKSIGDIPAWDGSDIPVPYEVAMEVGRMRRLGNYDDYPLNDAAKHCISSYIDDQRKKWPMPTDRTITLETGKGVAILNCCFGNRVNETLSIIYSSLLTARLGEGVGTSVEACRIILELPRMVDPTLLRETLMSLRPGSIEALARITITNSSHLRWRFVHVAKKFGIIDKKADHRYINYKRLFKLHNGTPAYKEAVNTVLWEDMDIPHTEEVVNLMDNGGIDVVLCGISRIGNEGITRSKELMQPVRADHAILIAMKKRLEESTLTACCLNCQNKWRMPVINTPNKIICPKCGGQMIALLKNYEMNDLKLLKKEGQDKEEKKAVARIARNANLVREYGGNAALVLSGRGIGPGSASRILRKYHEDEDDMLRDIMAAEVHYAQTKRFWD